MGTEFAIDWSLYSTRQSTQLNLFQCRISAAERAFRFRASNWNSLSNETRNSASFEAGFLSLSVELGFWIPIFSRIPDSLSSRVQSSGFQIPQAKFSRNTESRFPCMGRPLSTLHGATFEYMHVAAAYIDRIQNIWPQLHFIPHGVARMGMGKPQQILVLLYSVGGWNSLDIRLG